MKRRTLLAACGGCVAGLAGCQSSVSDDGATTTGTSTDQGPSPSTTTGTNASSDVSVEYVVLAGSVPDALQSVSTTFRVVFVTESDEMAACLLTHAHPDHIGFAEQLRETCDVSVWLHPADGQRARAGAEPPLGGSVKNLWRPAILRYVIEVIQSDADRFSIPARGCR
jgi:phosphoribosyl 1,2-cyclic phosphodiesterase